MKKLLVILGLGVAVYYGVNGRLLTSGTPGAFDSAGNPLTLIFTFPDCGQYCDKAVRQVGAAGVEYRVIDVAAGDENEALFDKYGGGRNFPYLVIGNRKVSGFDRFGLRSAMAEVYGLRVLPGGVRRVVKTHFNPSGDPKLVMYGADWCPYCKKVREHLQSEGVAFTEIDVEKSSTGEMYYNTLEGSGYPLVYVGARRIAGADLDKIDRAVEELMAI